MLRNILNIWQKVPKKVCLHRQFCSGKNMETENTIIVEQNGPVTLIGINRPQVSNCIDAATGQKLCKAINEFEANAEAHVGVLYGVGGSFCAGYDLSELSNAESNTENLILTPEGVMGPTRRKIKKPLVCAITGYCVAGGVELALMCDLRVMEECAIIGFFNRRFGVPLVDGGTARLGKLIGLSKALDLILTGRRVYAKEALEIGLANRVVATGTSFGQALNAALLIASFPQKCIQHDRDALYHATFESNSLEESMQYEVMTTTPEVLVEAKEGAEKFRQGIGRSGSFQNIKEIKIPDWERSEIEHEQKFSLKNKL